MEGEKQWTGVINNLVLKTNDAMQEQMKKIAACGIVFAACETR